MKALLWKECQENLKWAVLPVILLGGIMGLFESPSLMDWKALLFLSFVAAMFGAVLGFLQVFFESRGDCRALLLHRPMSHTQVFLSKTMAGVGLYLLAMGIPLACSVAWAATPGHVVEPFFWQMLLPRSADILTGLVYYFAGMLTAQREARWYGSRGLALPAAFLCSLLVWGSPEFWQALLALVVVGALVAVAAWGSFVTGGAYTPQPRSAKAALAATFLAGLLVVSVIGKFIMGAQFDSGTKHRYVLDREGRVLIVHSATGQNSRVTDLNGNEPQDLQGKRLDSKAIHEIEAPGSAFAWPAFHSYRNPGRLFVPFQNDSSPNDERWFYVTEQARLIGYDRRSKRLIGSLGPNGFVPPETPATDRFKGELHYTSFVFAAGAPDYLGFTSGVYKVDFAQRILQPLFTASPGETVLWAVRLRDAKQRVSLAFVGTDKSAHAVDETGSMVFSAPLAYDPQRYGLLHLVKLDNPRRFVVWYRPSVHLGREGRKTMPHYLIEYDSGGQEIARRTLPPVPLVQPSYAQALFGLITPMAEFAVLEEATQHFMSEGGLNQGGEIRPLIYMLITTLQYFIPGAGWDAAAGGPALAFKALMLLSGVLCATVCFVLARRFAFSHIQCIGWLLCGLLFGPVGLLLMLSLQQWPARIVCQACRKPRVVTRDACEHCSAPHAPCTPDGTEIFEQVAGSPHAVSAGC